MARANTARLLEDYARLLFSATRNLSMVAFDVHRRACELAALLREKKP